MIRCIALLAVLLITSGCTPLEIHRRTYELCSSSDPETQCERNALQERVDPSEPDRSYFLGFIEFDDQGQVFERPQMWAVLDYLYGRVGAEDLLMVVFVHGWKHSAAPGDGNIRTFRRTLMDLSAAESAIGRSAGIPARRVAGIYLGWRGASVTLPLLKEATFWDRKATAHKVGSGGVTEVLSRLELVQRTKDSMIDGGRSRTRLVVVGHSFGGAVVYSALSQIFEERLVHTAGPPGQVSDTRGFGDLVVLINPAFEAMRYAPLSDMSTERGHYFSAQLPVLAILTSEADLATKTAFPLGRWFSTMFENERVMTRKNGTTGAQESIDQGDSSTTAVGHFAPYRTHRLDHVAADGAAPRPRAQVQALEVSQSVALFRDVHQGWCEDRPGSTIRFQDSVLARSKSSAGRNPYMNIYVDGELIEGHNDIDDPRVLEFIKQLILISSQDPCR